MQLFRLREKFASYEPKSRDDSAGKKTGNTFVNTQLPNKELDRRQLGLEYDQDVTNDDEYIKKIFDTNAYHHDLKRPREYKASPVRREHMTLQKAKEPSGFSSTGNFPAFTATFSDNAQGKGLDNTLGIYALAKLGNRSYDIEGFMQEEFFLIKLRWLIRMAKGEVETNKRNLNNLRITIEKIIEEASPAFNIELFQDQKKVKVLLKKLTLLLVKVDAQKAILLSYKLFKMHIKQLDLQDPESRQEVATKLYSFFIPYTDLLEAKLSKRGALQKKKANLVTYRKIRNLCLRNDIAAILKEYPNPKAGQDYAARFKAFLREKTTLDKALAGLIPKSQRLSTNDSLTAENNNVAVGSLDDLDAPMPAEMFGSQSGFENAKSIDLDEKNDIGVRLNYFGGRFDNQVIPIELLESMRKSAMKPSPKITSHLKPSNLGVSTKSHHKHEQMEKQIQELMDDPELYQSPEDSEDSFTKGKENIDTNNNMLKPQPVQHKLDVLTRGVSSRDELNLRTGQTNIPQRIELVKMNSSQNPPPLKETVHQPQRESTFKKSSMKSSILAKDLNMSVTKKEIVFQKVLSIAYDNVSKWDNVTNSATIKIDKIKPENSPVVLLKAWAIVEGFTPKEVFEQIYDTTQRAKWDTVTVDLQVVEALGNNSEVIYFYIKTPFGITERDFVQKRDYIFDYPEKDTIVMSFQSCTHPAKPPLKKRIRGETHIAGYVIKPSTTKPHSTDLCILSQVDIKGQVPKAIVNLVAGKAPAEWVSKLRKACERTRMGKH